MTTRTARGWTVLAVLALAAGCAGRERADDAESPTAAAPRSVVCVDGARITVVHEPPDEAVAREVCAALPAAVARAQRWGPLPAATIVVHASEASFRAAVGETARRALRAWTLDDVVHLRSPRAWGLLGASRGELAEVLGHELVHCATWHRIGGHDAWVRRPLPFWFREGMAMEPDPALDRAVAGRLRSFERRWMAPPGESTLVHAETLLREDDDLAYGIARLAFRELVARGGDAVVAGILDRVRDGATFPDAFATETGSSLGAFDAAVCRAILAPR